MNWSARQNRHYQKLSARVQRLRSWKSIARACFEDAAWPGPAQPTELERIETALGRALPSDLKSLYLECGGLSAIYDSPIVMPPDEALRTNRTHRKARHFGPLYMPFDHLLLFGGEGNGDLYAFPIAIDGSYGNGNIYVWDHETDSRSWKAPRLKDLFVRLATDLV